MNLFSREPRPKAGPEENERAKVAQEIVSLIGKLAEEAPLDGDMMLLRTSLHTALDAARIRDEDEMSSAIGKTHKSILALASKGTSVRSEVEALIARIRRFAQ